LHIYEKKVQENLSRLSFNEFKLASNKTLGYVMPRVKLKMMCTARFWNLDLFQVLRLNSGDGILPNWRGILENWADYCRIKME